MLHCQAIGRVRNKSPRLKFHIHATPFLGSEIKFCEFCDNLVGKNYTVRFKCMESITAN